MSSQSGKLVDKWILQPDTTDSRTTAMRFELYDAVWTQ